MQLPSWPSIRYWFFAICFLVNCLAVAVAIGLHRFPAFAFQAAAGRQVSGVRFQGGYPKFQHPCKGGPVLAAAKLQGRRVAAFS
jgi:hypothetical protein